MADDAAPAASRLDVLRWERDALRDRMQRCESDQNYAVMGRLLNDVLVQIDDLGGGQQVPVKVTGLSDFEKRLREREATAKGSRRAKSG